MSPKSPDRIPEARTNASTYFALSLCWSAAFWFACTRAGGFSQWPGSILFYVAGAGPLVAALILVHGFESPAVQRDFWARTFDPRRIRGVWWAASLALHPLLVLGAIVIEVAMGGAIAIDTGVLLDPAALLSLVAFVFLFGPLPEEMGWRGVALDRLQTRLHPLRAALLLSCVWALWHLPLFFIEGTFQQNLGAGSLRFWIFTGSLFPLTVLIHWVYNHTERSILSAALVHFSGNFCGALIEKGVRLAALELAALTLATLVVARDPSLGRGANWKVDNACPSD